MSGPTKAGATTILVTLLCSASAFAGLRLWGSKCNKEEARGDLD
jgi:hypothetical protein